LVLELLFFTIEPFFAQINTQLHIFFRGRVELKDRGFKLKERVKKVVALKLVSKTHFNPQSF
jgi:hypothetical protein